MLVEGGVHSRVENEGEEEGEMAEGDKSLKSFDKDGLKA